MHHGISKLTELIKKGLPTTANFLDLLCITESLKYPLKLPGSIMSYSIIKTSIKTSSSITCWTNSFRSTSTYPFIFMFVVTRIYALVVGSHMRILNLFFSSSREYCHSMRHQASPFLVQWSHNMQRMWNKFFYTKLALG